jgi:hypothetical protein
MNLDTDTVVDVLMSHGLAMLSVLVDLGNTGKLKDRESLACMINLLPVLCRRGRLTASGEPAYAAVVWYEVSSCPIPDTF